MKADGGYTDFDVQDDTDNLHEQVVPWSYGKTPYAHSYNEGFSLNLDIRADVLPGTGRGIGWVEAPRGTLIHDYTTDENGLIIRANMIVGTTHNLGPINMSVAQAVRAYDP